jgi:hypothetical protein
MTTLKKSLYGGNTQKINLNLLLMQFNLSKCCVGKNSIDTLKQVFTANKAHKFKLVNQLNRTECFHLEQFRSLFKDVQQKLTAVQYSFNKAVKDKEMVYNKSKRYNKRALTKADDLESRKQHFKLILFELDKNLNRLTSNTDVMDQELMAEKQVIVVQIEAMKQEAYKHQNMILVTKNNQNKAIRSHKKFLKDTREELLEKRDIIKTYKNTSESLFKQINEVIL